MSNNQYLELFLEESQEHIQNINRNLLLLEQHPGDSEVINEVFRSAHTLKGIAGSMEYKTMTQLAHGMENILDGARSGNLKITPDIIDILFECVDNLESLLKDIMDYGEERHNDLSTLLSELEACMGSTAGGHEERVSIKTDRQPLVMDQYQEHVVREAMRTGFKAYYIQVKLRETCLMKSARAYIIFKTLEEHGEIVYSQPSVQDIEDEKFDYYFTVAVITKKDRVFFVKELNSVSEVRKVEITEITRTHLGDNKQAPAVDNAKRTEIKEDKHGAKDAAQKTSDKKVTAKTVRVDIERLDVLMNLVSELIIIKTRLDGIISAGERDREISQTLESLERVTTSLHDAVMKARMVPVETVFSRFPRMVRDIAKELNKDIVLHMSGEETELDRTVIDEIGEPLIHIIRNSADHGIEKPEDRIKKGKERTGNIWLRAYQEGNNVIIEVDDDGAGIDIEKVRRKILEKGLESEEIVNGLTDDEVIQYLFLPNFSTSDKITDISGRGVGLDVVKTKIEALGGSVDVISKRGLGSKIIIRLPLTLAIIQALLVLVGNEKFAIPLNSIREIYNLNPQDIKYVRNQEVTVLRDTVIPIIRLHNVLDTEVTEDDSSKKYLTCVVVKKGEKLTGLIVDSLINQQEIVIKSLGRLLSGIRFIAGATILGDGNVALILDVNSLV